MTCLQAKSTDAPQTTTSEVGEPSEAGVGGGRGEAESRDVKSKDKEKTTPQEQSEGAASSQRKFNRQIFS